MIRAVIFDCFGVLQRDSDSMLADLVSRNNYQEMKDVIQACDYGYITREEYFARVAELSGFTIDVVREFEEKQFVRNQPLIEILKELKKTYKVGLLSNIGDQTMDRLFPEPERSELFDMFVLSSDVGIAKPATELFQLMAKKLILKPEECIMVDDRQDNIEGARYAGMQAVLFTSNAQFVRDITDLLEKNSA